MPVLPSRHADEDLLSMLVRCSQRLDVRLASILPAVGLPRNWMGRALLPAQAASVAGCLGITVDEVLEHTLHRYPLAVTGDLTPTRSRFRHRGSGWASLAPTRACPSCLHDQPGVWHRDWNLGLYFVCEIHGLLLNDRCRHCGVPEAVLPACYLRGRPCTACSEEIPLAEREAIPAGQGLLAAQQAMSSLLGRAAADPAAEIALARVRTWLAVLATTGDIDWPPTDDPVIRTLRARHQLAQASTGFRRPKPSHDSEVSRPPRSVLTTAAYLPAALDAASGSSAQQRTLLMEGIDRQALMGRPRRDRWWFPNLGLEPPPRRAGRVSTVLRDLHDAAERIAEALDEHGLDASSVPAMLPSFSLPEMRMHMPPHQGVLWAAHTVRLLRGGTLAAACDLLGIRNASVRLDTGCPLGPFTSLAPEVAASLVTRPRDFQVRRHKAAAMRAVTGVDAKRIVGARAPRTASRAPLAHLLTAWTWCRYTHGAPRDAPMLGFGPKTAVAVHALGEVLTHTDYLQLRAVTLPGLQAEAVG